MTEEYVDMIADVYRDDAMLSKIRTDEQYAQRFYAAMCNVDWYPKSSPGVWYASWRTAGGIVAEIRNTGESYMDWYCSGNEGTVAEDVREDLDRLGWIPREIVL